jgi:hypothetical protein
MTDSLVERATQQARTLRTIKLVHTIAWAFFAACILLLPLAGALRRFDWALILTGLILLECGALALNHGRCPLTNIAAKYTDDRRDAFDIYLPAWLAPWNKTIFGTLFVLNELFVLFKWLRQG